MINEIISLCEKYNITNYHIREDYSIDVAGDVILNELNLTNLPLKFNQINGNFSISGNKITDLLFCPHIVSGDFNVGFNQLKSLEGSPLIVGGNFICSFNKLTSLKGLSQVGGGIYCSHNILKSLKYSPKIVNGNFICGNNDLDCLLNGPEKITETYSFECNKIQSLKHCAKEVGNLRASNNLLTDLQFFPYVESDIFLDYNQLQSLQGLPQKVNGDLYIDRNKLTSLKGCPREISKTLEVSHNQLLSLQYCPDKVGGDMIFSFNKIKNLDGFDTVFQKLFIAHYQKQIMEDIKEINIDNKFEIGHNELKSYLLNKKLESQLKFKLSAKSIKI